MQTFETYRDLADALDARGVRRGVLARAMGMSQPDLSRTFSLDPLGKPSDALVAQVFDALDLLHRGVPTEARA